jgi:CubicO group peptidase (beta-lactamase class C family)
MKGHRRRWVYGVVAAGVVCLVLVVGRGGAGVTLEAETVRAGVTPEWQKVLDQCRDSIPGRMKKCKIPGLSIAVVDREGVVWSAGFGRTGKGSQPVTPETLFSIQSMSKTFTATAVMMAVQDGLVDLDTPIVKYLPEFTVHSRFEDKPQEKITLRHLLSHTAGFTHEAPVGNNMDCRYGSFDEHVLSIQQTWLRHRVGERYSYSNLGIDLAGYILQVRSGQPFVEYMKKKVFEPLGMPNSSMDYAVVNKSPNRARGHVAHVSKMPVEIPMVAAGGVYTSAAELARFVQFHLNRGVVDGRVVLGAARLDTMYTSSPVSREYGLGIGVGQKHDTYVLNHGGGGFGFLTIMMWYPEFGVGCLVLTNSTKHDDEHVKIAAELLDELIARRLVARDTSGRIPTAEQLVGKDLKLSPLPGPVPTHTPTPYKAEWKRYEGTYTVCLRGFKLDGLATVATGLGLVRTGTKVTVAQKDGYLCLDKDKLEEYEPGLFFTPSGEVLDLRGPAPTWRNMKMQK